MIVGEEAELTLRFDALAVEGEEVEVTDTLTDQYEDESENEPHLSAAETEEELDPGDAPTKPEEDSQRPKLFAIKSIVEQTSFYR